MRTGKELIWATKPYAVDSRARSWWCILSTAFLLVGATDSRYYSEVSENVYRFGAFTYEDDAMERFHGTNERLSIEALTRAIAYYYLLLKNLQTI